MRTVGILLYDEFEALDAYGPYEFLSGNPFMKSHFKVVTITSDGKPVKIHVGQQVEAHYSFESCPHLDVLFIPGGNGCENVLKHQPTMDFVKTRSEKAEFVWTVCTGSWILAATGLLDGKRATSNKMVFAMAKGVRPQVNWIEKARWIEEGKYWTSSGVSAGMDMIFAAISKLVSPQAAKNVADAIEYAPHTDASWDPFSEMYKGTPAKLEVAKPPTKKTIGIFLYDIYEALDVYGPYELLGCPLLEPFFNIVTFSRDGKPVKIHVGQTAYVDYSLESCPPLNILFIPGGFGTIRVLYDFETLASLKAKAERAEMVWTVCTGSWILAQTGLLYGKRATSNKMLFSVTSAFKNIDWVAKARWVRDGKYWTSSGVSAGVHDIVKEELEKGYEAFLKGDVTYIMKNLASADIPVTVNTPGLSVSGQHKFTEYLAANQKALAGVSNMKIELMEVKFHPGNKAEAILHTNFTKGGKTYDDAKESQIWSYSDAGKLTAMVTEYHDVETAKMLLA
ncbi:hypothetical protein SmJEL517_g05784 [Synchytrium microbalum]|uniref:DJ-1/PfpI domain-containing protein n=1 Tax=Synchytrium microbalum TaxID=1806994 RepID=A0A507BJA8_9FUNG|nr:uncharacterized protein SmJEL517_g05784 [Synchytrium microbalum]TPX30700.1 hypothetical protein SmJEL517_g05784 [Synchytrium microbalum]